MPENVPQAVGGRSFYDVVAHLKTQSLYADEVIKDPKPPINIEQTYFSRERMMITFDDELVEDKRHNKPLYIQVKVG